jgi:hypothetical protein
MSMPFASQAALVQFVIQDIRSRGGEKISPTLLYEKPDEQDEEDYSSLAL